MKRLLTTFAVIASLVVGVAAPSAPASAEHADVAAGPDRVLSARLGNGHGTACVILDSGNLRCWGASPGIGVPGAGNVGDDETPDSVRPVDVGADRTVIEVDGGENFTCALLDNGRVRCWGYQTFGPMLGVPESGGTRIGDNEEPTTIPAIDLGGKATAIASGNFSSCAILEGGSVRCWGDGSSGRLGYGNTDDIGDDETPASVGPIDLGADRTATAMTVGRHHACAILDTGDVRCWGAQLSIPGQPAIIGDDELVSAGPLANLGGEKAVAISAGNNSTCVLTDADNVWCWGGGSAARYSTGEGAFGSVVEPTMMDLSLATAAGRTPASITVGFEHACIVFDDGTLYCWGNGKDGRLGYGDVMFGNDTHLGNGTVADPEPPLSGGVVDLERKVLTASAGSSTTCVMFDNLTVKCWGLGGSIGTGTTDTIGDDELPSTIGVINYNGTAAFTPLSPARILDTRQGQPSPAGQPKGKVAPTQSIDVQITGLGGVPDNDVYAVVLNVTLAAATGPGFVTAHPTGTTLPNASNINISAPGQNAPNSVIVPVGDNGKVTLYTSGGGHLIADVFGYFKQTGSATAGRLIGVTPARIFDTRPSKPQPGPIQGKGIVAPGATIEVTMTGANNVPATGVSAVVLNVTAANATGPGFVTVFPGDETQPATSNLNLSFTGESRPNTVIVPVSTTGTVKFYSEAGAHLLADITGYFTNNTAENTDDGLFVPLAPSRLHDTRTTGIIPAEGTTNFDVTGELDIPTTANAVVLNLTGVAGLAEGFVTGWPSDQTQPPSSNLNIPAPGINIANLAVLPLSLPSGNISLYTLGGGHLLADTSGYFL